MMEVQSWVCRLQQLGCNRTALAEEFLRAATKELALRAVPLAPIQANCPPSGMGIVVPR
jgi:hypothetical protein